MPIGTKRLGCYGKHADEDVEEDISIESRESFSDPRVQCVLLFGGHNAESEAYSNTLHLATVENIATSYINLNQLQLDERSQQEKSKRSDCPSSSDDSDSETVETTSAARNRRKGISELQKEEIRKKNSVKWRVVATHGKIPPERYRHSATVVRHKTGSRDKVGKGGGSVACSLVVYGGLGRGNLPCNDVYILDLDTLEWRELLPASQAAKMSWPMNGLYGHCALPLHIKGMWAKHGETDGDEEGEDVFGNVHLSAAARMAASTAGMRKARQQQHKPALTRGSTFDEFGEIDTYLTPEEEANLFQDVLIVYGGSGGDGGNHDLNKRNNTLNHQVDDEDEEDLDSQIRHAKSSGTSHTTKCLDLTTGEWRELNGSIAYPSARVNHTMALVRGWAPGNPERVAIQVGDQHHMTSMPPAPMLGSSKSRRGGQASKFHGGDAAPEEEKGNEQEQDACAVVFGGSSMSMCVPDAWCLDLKWRVPGVLGFDSNAASRTRDALRESIEWANRTQYEAATGAAKHLYAAMHHADHEHPGALHVPDPEAKGGTHIDLDLDRNYDTTHMRMTSTQPSLRSNRRV